MNPINNRATVNADAFKAYESTFGQFAIKGDIEKSDNKDNRITSNEAPNNGQVPNNGKKTYTATVKNSLWDAFVRLFTRNVSPSATDNNLKNVSKDFYTSVSSIFGGKIPPAVQKQLGVHQSNEGVMRPLTQRRITCVTTAITDLKKLADDFNAGKKMSLDEIKILEENGLITEIDTQQAELEGQSVVGKKEDNNTVPVENDQVSMLRKVGFEIKPTSANGNTLINSLLPQVTDKLDQMNEFSADEASGEIKRLIKQLKKDNEFDYSGRCAFTSHTLSGETWEQDMNSVGRDFQALDTERIKDNCKLDKNLDKKLKAASQSYRLLALAARTYQRPVVLISMFDEDFGDLGQARNGNPKKFVFGREFDAEPICIYRNQDGNYSRLAYTEEGHKTVEYKEFAKSQEPPKPRFTICGSSVSLADELNGDVTYESKNDAYLAYKKMKTEAEAKGETIPDWDGGEVPAMREEAEAKEKEKAALRAKLAEAKAKEEEVRVSVESEGEKNLKELHKKYQEARRKFVPRITEAYSAYVNKLPEPKTSMDRAKRSLLYKGFLELRDRDEFNRVHGRGEQPMLGYDEGRLEEAISNFEEIEEDFNAAFEARKKEIDLMRKEKLYEVLTNTVVDELSERFGNVPEEQIREMIAQSGEYYEKVGDALDAGVSVPEDDDMGLKNETAWKVVKDLVDLLEEKVDKVSEKITENQKQEKELKAQEQKKTEAAQKLGALSQKLEARLKLQALQKLQAHQKQEVEKQQKLEAQQRLEAQQKQADKLMPGMEARLKEVCANYAAKRFKEFYGKVADLQYKTKFEPMQMPPSVKKAAEDYVAKVVEANQETIRKAAMDGKSEFKARSVVDLADSILVPAFKNVRESVDADVQKKHKVSLFSDTIKVHKSTQAKRYIDLAPLDTMTNLFSVWSDDVPQQTQFANDVIVRLQQAATEYEDKLRGHVEQNDSLAGAPMPLDEKTVAQRQKQCAALLTGLTQLRASVGEMTKGKSFFGKEIRKDVSAEADAFLAEHVRPKLVQMVKSVVADGVTAKEALLKLAADLDADGLNAFVTKNALQGKIKNMKI